MPFVVIGVNVGKDPSRSSIGVEANVSDDIVVRYDRPLQTGLDLFWSYEY